MAKNMIVIMLCTLLYGCGRYPTKPIPTQEFRDAQKPNKHLIVLLSGRGANLRYFETNRWPEIAQKYTQEYDFVAPFAHYGYYISGELVQRLHEDIILPAKKQGYTTISMAGISMGGLGCLLYSRQYPADIDRIYLVAPFLAKDAVHTQIQSAGGLHQWRLREEDNQDWNFTIWQRLQDITSDPLQQQKLFLGYGDNDRLNGHDLLAQALPQEQVIKLQGHHDDVTFAELWEAMLAQGFLKRSSGRI